MAKTPTYYLLVGAKGSGKTEQVSKFFGGKVINFGEIENKFKHRYQKAANSEYAENMAWKETEKEIRTCLEHGDSVVLDAQNLTKKARRNVLSFASGIDCQFEAIVTDNGCAEMERPTHDEGFVCISTFITRNEAPNVVSFSLDFTKGD